MTGDSIAAEADIADVQLLELELGDTRFAIDIQDVDEIVERKSLTAIPNSPPHVAGVMDLRGETTRIIEPKEVLDVEGGGVGDWVVILDRDGSHVGWIVDGVFQVFCADQYDVESAEENPTVEAILHDDDGFIMWVDPEQLSH